MPDHRVHEGRSRVVELFGTPRSRTRSPSKRLSVMKPNCGVSEVGASRLTSVKAVGPLLGLEVSGQVSRKPSIDKGLGRAGTAGALSVGGYELIVGGMD